MAEEGLSLDVCSGGELTVALRAGTDPARIGFHGNNKSIAELRRALEAGVGRIVVDSFDEIDRLARARRARPAGPRRSWCGSPPASRRTPTSTSPPRTRTRSSASPSTPATRSRRSRGSPRSAGFRLLGLHSHIGSQIFDTSGFEVAARRVLALHAKVSGSSASRCRSSTSAAGSASPTPTQDDPSDAAPARCRAHQDRRARVPRARRRPCPGSRSSPAAPSSGPSMCTLYEVGTVKVVELDAGARPRLRLRRRWHERQHPHRAVRRRLLGHAGVALLDAPRRCSRGWWASTARPATSSSRTSSCPVTWRPATCVAVPATGAYCRSMASNYNHAAPPAGGGGPRTARRGWSSAVRPRTTCSAPTSAWADWPPCGRMTPTRRG